MIIETKQQIQDIFKADGEETSFTRVCGTQGSKTRSRSSQSSIVGSSSSGLVISIGWWNTVKERRELNLSQLVSQFGNDSVITLGGSKNGQVTWTEREALP